MEQAPSKPPPRLAVRTSSWHYQYYSSLKRFWGLTSSHETSLCPYVQTMIWLSVASCLMAPFMILGWVLFRGSRLIYKGLEATGVGQAIVDGMNVIGFGKWLDYQAEKIETHPALTLIMALVEFALIIFAFAVVLSCIGLGFWWLPEGLAWVWFGITWAAWGIWWLLIHIGWLLTHVGFAIVWTCTAIIYLVGLAGEWLYIVLVAVVEFLTNLWLWQTIGHILFWGFVTVVACMALGLFVSIVSRSKSIRKIFLQCSYVLNGYVEAREKTEEREAARPPPVTPVEPVEPKGPGPLKMVWLSIATPAAFVGSGFVVIGSGIGAVGMAVGRFFGYRLEDARDGSRKVLSIFAVLGHYIVALKKGVCPIVEFVDEEEEPKEED